MQLFFIFLLCTFFFFCLFFSPRIAGCYLLSDIFSVQVILSFIVIIVSFMVSFLFSLFYLSHAGLDRDLSSKLYVFYIFWKLLFIASIRKKPSGLPEVQPLTLKRIDIFILSLRAHVSFSTDDWASILIWHTKCCLCQLKVTTVCAKLKKKKKNTTCASTAL